MRDHLANGIVGWRRNSWAVVARATRTPTSIFFTLTLKQQPLSNGDTKAGPLVMPSGEKTRSAKRIARNGPAELRLPLEKIIDGALS